jgi:hypothetical protein
MSGIDWLEEFTFEDISTATEFLKLMVKALADQLDSKERNAFFKLAHAMKENGDLKTLFQSTSDDSQQYNKSNSQGGTSPRQRIRSVSRPFATV